MPEKTLEKIEEKFVEDLKAAGKDEIQLAMAKKLYYLRNMGYLGLTETHVNAALFNENRSGSYHPWSALVLGEAFGESGLKEFISLKDYMNTTPLYDEVLKGVVTGAKKLAERNAAAAAAAAAKLKGKSNEYSEMASNIINKGK